MSEPVKIKFFAAAGDIANAPTHESDPEEFETMPTEDELNSMAQEFMYESVQPDAWWEVVE